MSTKSEPPPSLSPTDVALLRDALENGYFEDPSGMSLEDIAAAHDVSEQEAKRRLARGLSILLRHYRSTDAGSLSEGLLSEPAPWTSAG